MGPMNTTIDIFKFERDVQVYAAGETIFQAGDKGQYMYVIQVGTVDVIATSGEVIDSLTVGDIFGEMALIDHSPRSASVVAKTDCRLVALDEQKFLSHVHRTPFFALQVMRILAERLRARLYEAS